MNLKQLLTPYLPDAGLVNFEINVQGLVTDNRDVKPGDCFIALAGITHHGKQFIDDAITRGACAVLVESEAAPAIIKKNAQGQSIPVIALPDLNVQLNKLLIDFYQLSSQGFTMRLLGITGTNGKTSIARFVAQMSHALHQPAGLMGTLGFGVWPEIVASKNTTPELAVLLRQFSLMQNQGAELVAMEVSSHGIEQNRVEGLIFDSAVFANLSQDHLDYHGDMESYFSIKRELFLSSSLLYAIINSDDEYGQRLLADDEIKAKKISYGFADNADVRVVSWQMHSTSIDAEITTPWGDASFNIDMVGDFNLANVLAAVTLLAVNSKFDFAKIIAAIKGISPAPGRMQAYRKTGSVPVVVDFAHTPDALKNVLSTLTKQTLGKLAVVFGCGGDRDQDKRPLMAGIAQELADQVSFTSDNPRNENIDDIIQGMKLGLDAMNNTPVSIEKDREQAIHDMVVELTADDLLLIAGKGHEAYQDIGGHKVPYSDEGVLIAMGYQETNKQIDERVNKEESL
jgi:UDP-N-acetylmuramoyl-L-alanyl-D-glutamate--2,6-diaminopimelate ligase